jgi:hypothetical protein
MDSRRGSVELMTLGYKAADTWARRKLVIGNPYPCTNFFRTGVKGGDLYAKHGSKGTNGSVLPVDSGRDASDLRSLGETHGGVSGYEDSLLDAMCREVLAEMVATGVERHLTLQQGPEGIV